MPVEWMAFRQDREGPAAIRDRSGEDRELRGEGIVFEDDAESSDVRASGCAGMLLADPTPGLGPRGVVDGHVTLGQDSRVKPLEILGPRVPLSGRVRVVGDEHSDTSHEVERGESPEDAAVADGPRQKDRVRDDEHQEKLAPEPLPAEPSGKSAGEPDERNEVENRPGQAEKAGKDSQPCDAPRRERTCPRSRAEH